MAEIVKLPRDKPKRKPRNSRIKEQVDCAGCGGSHPEKDHNEDDEEDRSLKPSRKNMNPA